MGEWKNFKLSELGEVIGGSTPSTKREEYYGGNIAWITPKDLSGYQYRFISKGSRNISEEGLNSCSLKMLPKNSILFTSRAPIGYVAIAENDLCTNQGFKSIIPNENVDYMFMYYLMKYNKEIIEAMGSGTTFKEVSGTVMKNVYVKIPIDKKEQQKISKILSSLDEKIEINRKINENLEEQAKEIFKYKFSNNDNYNMYRIGEYFDISIGKTPPRKEEQWFSKNESDIVWISIADMKSSSIYINKSSEYITNQAIIKHNIKIIPDNTVILSFKLTIGRVAITDGQVTTNEAIAHFKTDKKEITEYLYFYLKNFNYDTMGSTSSIASAINSKIIKSIPFMVPNEDDLLNFHRIVNPIFQQIKINQYEIQKLSLLRDELLPKLMTGEIDVSEIDI